MTECGITVFLIRNPSRDVKRNVNPSELVEDTMTVEMNVVEEKSVSYEENTKA